MAMGNIIVLVNDYLVNDYDVHFAEGSIDDTVIDPLDDVDFTILVIVSVDVDCIAYAIYGNPVQVVIGKVVKGR